MYPSPSSILKRENGVSELLVVRVYFLTFSKPSNPFGKKNFLTMTSVPCVTSFVRTAFIVEWLKHSVCQDFALGEKLNPNLLLPIAFVVLHGFKTNTFSTSTNFQCGFLISQRFCIIKTRQQLPHCIINFCLSI